MTQDKRSPSMTMQEQARLSGLEFLDDSSLEPQWSTTREEYPPLLGGWRNGHASVVVDHDNEVQSIVVMGGETEDHVVSDSVIVWDSSTKHWRQGPRLNEKRDCFAAETCNGKVYVIGGDNDFHLFDTIECIDVASLLTISDSSICQWKTLSCRLSTARKGCTAVVVHDRYIVIMGGYNGSKSLSTVEVLDTLQNKIVSLSGLTMNSPRSRFGAAVVGNSIYAIGGINNDSKKLDSVEVLTFNVDVDSIGDASTIFGKSSSWTMSKDLVLSKGRYGHGVAKIGNCVVMAGGLGIEGSMNSVEVLDPYRHVVWHLPNMTVTRCFCSIAVLSNNIVVLGDENHASLETLALVDKQDKAKVGWNETVDYALSNVILFLINCPVDYYISWFPSCEQSVALVIQGMFSSRQELGAENKKLQNDVLFAQEENRDISALGKGIEAERRLPRLKLLRRDQKLSTMQDMKEDIKFLVMDLEQMSSLEDRLSIVKKINTLLEQIGPDEICATDESNVRGKQDTQEVGGTRETVFCQEICIHLHHSPSRLSRLHANYFFDNGLHWLLKNLNWTQYGRNDVVFSLAYAFRVIFPTERRT